MERVSLEIQPREEVGKQLVKRLRQEGFIPGVIYQDGKDSLKLKVSEKDFKKVLRTIKRYGYDKCKKCKLFPNRS